MTLPGTSATLTIVGFGLRPELVTELLGVQPTDTSQSYVKRCGSSRKDECGLWSFNSEASVSSEEIEQHVDHILATFRPIRTRIEELRPRPNIFLNLRCRPASVLRPFNAPRISAAHIAGIAELGAALTIELIAG